MIFIYFVTYFSFSVLFRDSNQKFSTENEKRKVTKLIPEAWRKLAVLVFQC